MARPSRTQIMELFKKEIIEALSTADKAILNYRDIAIILEKNSRKWRLPYSTTTNDFLDFLRSKQIVEELIIDTPKEYIYKYVFKKDLPIYNIALSIQNKSYLSHYSAVFLHDLTNNIVKTIYVTTEQTDKKKSNSSSELEQTKIDYAFAKPMRISNKFAVFNDYKIYLLNGKFSNNKGVITTNDGLHITNIERTLIDIAVRPDYSGGIFEVLEIFKRAKGKVSINKLSATLKALDYIYPYHQAIGFYLEKAGYKESVVSLMEKIPMQYDFYLTYNMKNKRYSDRWKLFYPEGL